MNATKDTDAELRVMHAREMLEKYCPKGATVYCVLRSRAKSGMSRRIAFFVLDGQRVQHIGGWLAAILDKKLGDDLDIRVTGCGMDMGYHVVSQLAYALHKDEQALRSEWI